MRAWRVRTLWISAIALLLHLGLVAFALQDVIACRYARWKHTDVACHSAIWVFGSPVVWAGWFVLLLAACGLLAWASLVWRPRRRPA